MLNIPERLFPNKVDAVTSKLSDIRSAKSIFDYAQVGVFSVVAILLILLDIILRAALAALIGFVDTLLWTALVFSTAAPMIISGLYEANVDRQVISFIEKNSRSANKQPSSGDPKNAAARSTSDVENAPTTELKTVRPVQKIHLLYAILVGNLEIVEPSSPDCQSNSTRETSLDPPSAPADAWSDIKHLVKLFDDSQLPGGERTELEATGNRLHTMLGSQARFGVTIAAALCFFLGSFLVNVISNLEDLGNNDTSHALGFGEWWMTIPFVAIVAGCLLAGNNPNTLGGIMSGVKSPTGHVRRASAATSTLNKNPEPATSVRTIEFFREVVMPALFGGVYEPVWMWERGRNKRRWIEKVQEEYAKKPTGYTSVLSRNSDTKIPTTTVLEWLVISFLVVALLLIPFTLAFLTSYYTPIIGLGCRSFTFVLYFLFQSLLSILWLVDFQGSWNTFETGPKHGTDDRPIRSKPGKWIFGILFGVCFFLSVFSAIGGTFMQIAGVYRNCKCLVPIAHWDYPDSFVVVLSTNSRDDIRYAEQYWRNNGIAAIVLLAIVCYSGWWYQRHWRLRLAKSISKVIDEVGTTGGEDSKPKGTTDNVSEKEPAVTATPAAEGEAITPAV